MSARHYELNFHIPKLQLLETFPLTPFLTRYDDITVFDVGGNTGVWAEAFLKTHKDRVSRYRLFEPMPENVRRLERRADNVLKSMVADIQISEVALGAEKGSATIHFDKEVSTLASIRNNTADLGAQSIALDKSREVQVSTVKAAMEAEEIDTLHLLKIDVEGFEMNVLKGAETALTEGRVKNVFFEFGVHQTSNGETFKDFFDLLRGYGMSMYVGAHHRNFFGFHPINHPDAQRPFQGGVVEMVLASMEGPDPNYRGPKVVTAHPLPVPEKPSAVRRQVARLRRAFR